MRTTGGGSLLGRLATGSHQQHVKSGPLTLDEVPCTYDHLPCPRYTLLLYIFMPLYFPVALSPTLPNAVLRLWCYWPPVFAANQRALSHSGIVLFIGAGSQPITSRRAEAASNSPNLKPPNSLHHPLSPPHPTSSPPGQCSSNVPPPPLQGAPLPAPSPSLSARSPRPSCAVRDSPVA